jgi:imidazole glycerol-phosphate synthase subunit HisH
LITLVDYGLGNIRAFANIYRQLNIPVAVVDTAEALRQARKIILPGVGAFDWAMTQLNRSGLRDALDRRILDREADVLGVCVGMQMMARRSEEGEERGLGWIDADVLKFDVTMLNHRTRLPHMGWNSIAAVGNPLFARLEESQFYFLHSFYVQPAKADDILARASYGIEFAAAVGSGNVYGTQFHPEKSHAWGIRLLKNFAEL